MARRCSMLSAIVERHIALHHATGHLFEAEHPPA